MKGDSINNVKLMKNIYEARDRIDSVSTAIIDTLDAREIEIDQGKEEKEIEYKSSCKFESNEFGNPKNIIKDLMIKENYDAIINFKHINNFYLGFFTTFIVDMLDNKLDLNRYHVTYYRMKKYQFNHNRFIYVYV